MAIYSDNLKNEVRLEYLRPEQIETIKAVSPFIFVAFGSIEWHGYHNVVGLDTLKAHEQLVGLASRIGGVVYPPVYFGAGGGHTDWPSSFMVDGDIMLQLTKKLLYEFERDGYRKVILLSGHYPNKPEFLETAAIRYKEAGGSMRVLVLMECDVPGVGGDHAAFYETSSMLHLHPETVALETIESPEDCPDDTKPKEHNWMISDYKNHPCYGLVGFDPRGKASQEVGEQHTEKLLAYLEAWIKS